MANGKLREARNTAEKLAAILVMAIKKNEDNNIVAIGAGRKENHILGAGDFQQIVEPFLDLAESSAQLIDAKAGKVIGEALRQRSIVELEKRQTEALFKIAELIRVLELPNNP